MHKVKHCCKAKRNDMQNMTMSLKDSADTTKELYHHEEDSEYQHEDSEM